MKANSFSSVQTVIFDLDGTLIDSKRDLILSVNATLRQMGRAELDDDIISSYIGRGAPLLVSRALGGNMSEEELKRGLQIFFGLL